jgi:DNA-binding CsgD family transcriptional regulator
LDERRELVREWVDWVARATDFQARLQSLSRRERTVLDLLAAGTRVSEVAAQLGVAEGTVRSQVKSLRRKLGVDSQIAAVAAVNLYAEDVAAIEVLPSPPRQWDPRETAGGEEGDSPRNGAAEGGGEDEPYGSA